MKSAAEMRPFWALVSIVVVLDRLTKLVAEQVLGGHPIEFIGDVVRWRLVYNRGAAFGLGSALGPISRWLFMLVAVIAVWLLWRMSREAASTDRLRQFSVGLVAGGAFGNLIDRLITARGVTDFIDVGIGSLRWPTFNVADMAVSCGAVALAISLWREDLRHRHDTVT